MGTSGLIQSPVCFNHSASFTDSIEVSWKIVRLDMGLVSGVVKICLNMIRYRTEIEESSGHLPLTLIFIVPFYLLIFDLRKSLIEYQRNCTCIAFVVYLIKEKV